MEITLSSLERFLVSKLGKKQLEKAIANSGSHSLLKRKLEKIMKQGNFISLVEKAITRFSLTEKQDKGLPKSVVLPKVFGEFFYQYASTYGLEVTHNPEFRRRYGNTFTSGLFLVDGYFFNLVENQGRAILISKEVQDTPGKTPKVKRFCKGCQCDVTDTMFCYCGEFYLTEASTYTEEELKALNH